MPRKILIITISSFAVLFFLLYWVYFAYFTANETDPLRLVPAESAVVIETPNLKDLTKRLKNDNEIWQTIKGFSFMKTNSQVIANLDSLLTAMPELDQLTAQKRTVLSLLAVKETAEVLVILPLPTKTDEKLAHRFFKKYCKNNTNFEKQDLEGTSVYAFKYGKKKKRVFISACSKALLSDRQPANW